MQTLPPHLPKKEKTVRSTNPNQSLFYFISCTLIAIAASLSTVFVAFSWIVPRAIPEVQFYSFDHKTATTEPTVDTALRGRIQEREALLFDTRKQLGTGWYPAQSALSSGVFLTSDGWALFPLSVLDLLDKKNLEVVDSRGAAHTIENIFVDKNFDVVYIKVKGEGFRFISFPNWNTLEENTSVVGKQGQDYVLTSIAPLKKNVDIKTPVEIWKPQYVYTFDTPVTGIIFSDQGELMGVEKNGGLMPGWYIETGFLSLLSKQKLSYTGFAWKGELVDRGVQNGFVKEMVGFFVTEGDVDKNGIRVGDVITKIQDQEFSFATLGRLVLQGPDTVSVELIRDGVTVQKTLSKQMLTF